MENFNGHYRPTKTTEFLINLNKFVYIFGLPNYWVEDLDFSGKFKKVFNKLGKYGNLSIIVFIVSEYIAFFTQKNLTNRQSSNLILFTISHSIVEGFCVRMSQQEAQIRDVMYTLGIGLKDVYNNSEVEYKMIKRSKFFSSALVLNCIMCVCMYTVEAIVMVKRAGVTFNTVITAWPDIDDRSVMANIGRTVFYLIWWIYLTRTFAVYTLVICLTIAVSHQFMNLNSYFYRLTDIFDEDIMQREKEAKYERALKVGIKIHSETLKCTDDIQKICRDVFSGQMVFNIILLIVLMYQMMNSPRNLTNGLTLVLSALAILLSTGFFMWNAGDITVEAEKLPTAMFSSGWENCRGESSVRVRKLLVIAMMQAQQPVALKGLGIILLSYQSYVSIVKSSYSTFSVLY